MRILLTGATGLVGQELGKKLVDRGHQLVVITRSAHKAKEFLPFPCEIVEGDLTHQIIHDARLHQIEAVYHLMGESVAAGRWTEKRKVSIRKSRVQSTENLIQSLGSAKLKTFISASAIGIYGDRANEVLDEGAAFADTFLAKICQDWEQACRQISGTRTVQHRFGIILSRNGGALQKMLAPFRLGVGGALGDGQHWMSWIHIEDAVAMLLYSLENDQITGAINTVAPSAVQNLEFSQRLATSLGKKLGPAIPSIVLRLLYGEMATILFDSQKVFPEKILKSGFQFKFPNLEMALSDLCSVFQNDENIFTAEQYIDCPPEQVFTFFSEAKNLEKITPDSLQFKILSMSTDKLQKGTLIDYKLKIHGVPAGWQTLIEEWQPPKLFVDRQLKGPYRLWHHTHSFEALGTGTLIKDLVRYQLPMGLLGQVTAGGFVRKDIQNIFAYRRKAVGQYFSNSSLV